MKRHNLFLLPTVFFVSLVVFTQPVFAKLGVGVATGKIVVEQILHPGEIYNLPPLNVLNTGDETAVYGVGIAYHESQWEARPAADWFKFKPSSFELKPGESQTVTISLQLPVKAQPGKYFAYVEGFPQKKAETGGTSIGIAAATKLYFEIAPSNLLTGLYYRLITFWKDNLPWSNIIGGTLAGLLILSYLKRHFHIEIHTKKPKDE